MRATKRSAGKSFFHFALLLLLAWLCTLPWILIDRDPPLATPPSLQVDPSPSE